MTGTGVAEALLNYAQYVIRADTSVTVTIPVLERNGRVFPRTLLLGPATQLESQYADGVIDEEEEELRFPVPEFTPVGGKGTPRDIEPLPTFPTS